MAEGLSYREIAQLAKQTPEAFATEVLGMPPTQRMGNQVRYFESGWLAVFTSGRHQGTWISFQDEKDRGDMLDLYRWHTGNSAHEAVVFAKKFLRLENGPAVAIPLVPQKTPEEIAREEAEENAKRIRTAQWIWRNASATDGREDGLRYLRNRGITAEIPQEMIRFRRLSPAELEKMGVARADIPKTPVVSVILKATDAQGQITAVQQILTTEGRKVGFENPKRTNGLMHGAAVRLGNAEAAGEVILVEGPETGLSIWQATGRPTYITLGTSNFTKVGIPDSVSRLVVAADMEESGVGLASALRAAQFWTSETRAAGIALPRMNEGDFNDMLKLFGDDAVRVQMDRAFFPARRGVPGVVFATTDSRSAFYAWTRTGTETLVRVPPLNKQTGHRNPLNLDGHVEPHHRKIIVLEADNAPIQTEVLAERRPDLVIERLAIDVDSFRRMGREAGSIETLLAPHDIHAPSGTGTDEPVILTLRRNDADALEAIGQKAIAVRATALDTVDLGFMAGRDAIVAPVGTGTEPDRRLFEKLEAVGARPAMLAWQIFRPNEHGSYDIVRNAVPSTYGAADAVEDGWTGQALSTLIEVAKFHQVQAQAQRAAAIDREETGTDRNATANMVAAEDTPESAPAEAAPISGRGARTRAGSARQR